MFENIPNELKQEALWCCWRIGENGKVPIDVVKREMAKSNDRKTFYTWTTILKHVGIYLRKQDDRWIGGLGLGIFNGFSAIDIDHCIVDGKISDMAQEIIDYCQSYTEKSPSGTGIRIIFKTNFKDFDKTYYYINNRKIGLEIYIEGVTNKFVTITGDTILACGVNNVDIEYLLDKYMKKQVRANNTPKKTNTYNTYDFIDKDAKLCELWNGNAAYSSQSEHDLALCSKLAFYLQRDPDAIRIAFEQSPYYASKDAKHKKKWDTIYSDNTISLAVDSCQEVYTPTFTNRTKYELNDTGNAHRFIDEFGADLHYNVDNKMWMLWNGSNWQFDIFNNVKNLAEILIEKMKMEALSCTDADRQKELLKNINKLYNSAGKESMLKESQHLPLVPVNNDAFDRDDYLFNTNSYVVNLKTGKTISHNKNLLLNKISPVDLSNKKPVQFLRFFEDIFKGDKEIMHYVHKALGYSLTGDCREQVLFMLVGDGNDGKSLLLQIIQEVIGDYAITSNPDLLLDKKTQTANLSEVARLKGMRFCVVNELKPTAKLNESGVKDITSGNNKIVARFLYCNEFEFLPKMKIWLATNHLPQIIGTDKGIWRRIVKIPMTRNLQDDEVDQNLIYKLRTEKNEIFTWLVEGCLMWQKEGLKLPPVLEQEKQAYKTEMDLVQKWINENCELGKYITKASELYEDFKNYCKINNEYEMSQTLFGRNFGKKFNKKLYAGATVYEGIRLRSNI